jgi:hypothetical protein
MSQDFRTVYTLGPEPVKLSELRAKTDQQLRSLVHSKLELGLNFIALAEAGDRACAGQALERADQALAEVQRLLPALNDEQGRAFDPKFTELRDALDRLGRQCASGTTHTASAF